MSLFCGFPSAPFTFCFSYIFFFFCSSCLLVFHLSSSPFIRANICALLRIFLLTATPAPFVLPFSQYFFFFLFLDSWPFVWISIQCECRATQRAEMKMFKWKIDWILMNFGYTLILTCTHVCVYPHPDLCWYVCRTHTHIHFPSFLMLVSSFLLLIDKRLAEKRPQKRRKLCTQKLHWD